MEPKNLQDVVRCHICETPNPALHCEMCNNHLCKDCEKNHLSERRTEHKVVPFYLRGCIKKCTKHSTKICERYCEHCDFPVCEECTHFEDHNSHELIDVVKKLEIQKQFLQKDVHELEKKIYSKYQEKASNILLQKADLNKNSQKLKAAIINQREKLHTEIDTIMTKLISDVDEMDSKQLDFLNEQENEVKRIVSEITQVTTELNKLLNSNDVKRISANISRNAEFRTLLSKFTVTLPSFTPHMINKEQLYQQFGSLTTLSINIIDESSSQCGQIIDKQRVITDIRTEYGGACSVSCLDNDKIWICVYNYNIINLYNLKGEIISSIKTKSGNYPNDISVTNNKDLVYTDRWDRTVNIVKNTQIQEVIRAQNWVPLHICGTSSGDLLVVMCSDDEIQSKVVRFSGSTEKQNIQYDDNGKPLFSSGCYSKYISENRNLDICVSDWGARAIVVTNVSGKFRFTYSGNKSTFLPYGVTTDSQSRILTADFDNNCIHILDKDGQFLRSIDNCQLQRPYGLCVDTKDNLYITEPDTGKVRKIQYCK